MGETTDRFEDAEGERPRDTLDDFRKEIQAESQGEGPPGQEGTDESHGEPATTAQGDGGQETADHVADEELESFRKEMLEEYEPEGLGEGVPDWSEVEIRGAEQQTQGEATVDGRENPRPVGSTLEEQTGTDDVSESRAAQVGEPNEGSENGVQGKGPDEIEAPATLRAGMPESDATNSSPKDDPEPSPDKIDVPGAAHDGGPDEQWEARQEGAAPRMPDGTDVPNAIASASSHHAELPARDDPHPVLNHTAESLTIEGEDLTVTSEQVSDDVTSNRVESYSPNANQIVVTEREGPDGPGKVLQTPTVETHDSGRIPSGAQVEKSEEVRTFEAVDYGKGTVARFPKTDLEEAGAELEPGENAVVGLRLKDAQSDEVGTVFARFNANDRRAEAYVGDIGGEKGSRYELLEVWRVDKEKLVGEFERGRPEHLRNVRLEYVEEQMSLNVDGRSVELDEVRLSTSGSHAIVRGSLEGKANCKVEFDGRHASVRLGRDYPVEQMRIEGDELIVRYAQSRSEKHDKRIQLERLEAHPVVSSARTSEKPCISEVGRTRAKTSNTTTIEFERDDQNRNQTSRPETPESIRTAVKYMSSTALLIPESVTPLHKKSDVLEVRLARESASWKVYTLYCKESPGGRRAYLDLRQLDAQPHERFRVLRVEVHRFDTFASEYNAKRPRGLENTELVKREHELVMKLDRREVPLEDVVLRSQEGRAVIDAKLGNSGIKIANGIGASEIRLKDHSRVTGIETTSEGVVLSYQRTTRDPYPHRRIIMEGEPESPHFVRREGPLLVGRIEIESRSYARYTIEFKLRANDAAYEHVFNSLAECGNPDAFKKLKGDIAEEIVKQLSPDLGLTRIVDHPFNDDPLKTGSERWGPDSLVRLADSQELAYVEVKWWAYKAGAAKEAEAQVIDDLRNHPTWEGKEVKGAYIAILDWNLENKWSTLTLKRAGPAQLNPEP